MKGRTYHMKDDNSIARTGSSASVTSAIEDSQYIESGYEAVETDAIPQSDPKLRDNSYMIPPTAPRKKRTEASDYIPLDNKKILTSESFIDIGQTPKAIGENKTSKNVLVETPDDDIENPDTFMDADHHNIDDEETQLPEEYQEPIHDSSVSRNPKMKRDNDANFSGVNDPPKRHASMPNRTNMPKLELQSKTQLSMIQKNLKVETPIHNNMNVSE